jgi:iron-sulfur cluster assembly accessory protein
MLTLTEKARERFKTGIEGGALDAAHLRVFIDHRCHCGKAHFALALENEVRPDDTVFEVGDVPFVADAGTAPELPAVEIDFVETVWTKGFAVRNTNHDCNHHMMQ